MLTVLRAAAPTGPTPFPSGSEYNCLTNHGQEECIPCPLLVPVPNRCAWLLYQPWRGACTRLHINSKQPCTSIPLCNDNIYKSMETETWEKVTSSHTLSLFPALSPSLCLLDLILSLQNNWKGPGGRCRTCPKTPMRLIERKTFCLVNKWV